MDIYKLDGKKIAVYYRRDFGSVWELNRRETLDTMDEHGMCSIGTIKFRKEEDDDRYIVVSDGKIIGTIYDDNVYVETGIGRGFCMPKRMFNILIEGAEKVDRSINISDEIEVKRGWKKISIYTQREDHLEATTLVLRAFDKNGKVVFDRVLGYFVTRDK